MQIWPDPRQITTPASHYSSFLQTRCPSCRPTDSVKALKVLIKWKQTDEETDGCNRLLQLHSKSGQWDAVTFISWLQESRIFSLTSSWMPEHVSRELSSIAYKTRNSQVYSLCYSEQVSVTASSSFHYQYSLLRHVRREWALLSFHSVCLDVCRSRHCCRLR